MSHAQVFGDVWSRSTSHSLEEWMDSDAVGAFLSRPTNQTLKKRVIGDVWQTSIDVSMSVVLQCLVARHRSLSQGMGGLGGGGLCLVSPHRSSSREAGGR